MFKKLATTLSLSFLTIQCSEVVDSDQVRTEDLCPNIRVTTSGKVDAEVKVFFY